MKIILRFVVTTDQFQLEIMSLGRTKKSTCLYYTDRHPYRALCCGQFSTAQVPTEVEAHALISKRRHPIIKQTHEYAHSQLSSIMHEPTSPATLAYPRYYSYTSCRSASCICDSLWDTRKWHGPLPVLTEIEPAFDSNYVPVHYTRQKVRQNFTIDLNYRPPPPQS